MGYRWAPAGLLPGYESNAHLFFTYKKTGVLNYEYAYDPVHRVARVRFPDREIISMFRRWKGDSGKNGPYKKLYWPESNTYDEYLPASVYSADSFMEDVTPYVLISAHNGMEVDLSTREFLSGGNYKVIGDSGGSQLKHGTKPYVDPAKVIEWLNGVADLGCALDAPPRPVDQNDKKVMKALCDIQLMNNKVYFDNWNGNLKLLNAVHGFTVSQVREWAKAVDDERFYGWCAGQDSVTSFLAGLRTTLVAMKEFPKKHYHTFGLGGASTRIPIAAWLGRYADSFTSDSTTHMASLRWRVYFYLDPKGDIEKIRVGNGRRQISQSKSGEVLSDSGPPRISMDFRPLPCSCPICHRVKYPRFFSLPAGSGAATALNVHNMWVTGTHANTWSRLADSSKSVEEYLDAIAMSKSVSVSDSKMFDMRVIIGYIEAAMSQGIEIADRRYQSLTGDDAVHAGRMKKLFAGAKSTRCEDPNLKQAMLSSQKSSSEDVIPAYLGETEMRSRGIRRLGY